MSSYTLDAWAVAQHPDPIRVVEHLVDRLQRPGWNRERLCRGCEHWTPSQGEHTRPLRPGAGELDSCSGCWYSHLDLVDSTAPLEELEREADYLDLSIDRAKGRRRQELRERRDGLRALRYELLEHQEQAQRRWRPGTRYAAIEWRDGRHHVVLPPAESA